MREPVHVRALAAPPTAWAHQQLALSTPPPSAHPPPQCPWHEASLNLLCSCLPLDELELTEKRLPCSSPQVRDEVPGDLQVRGVCFLEFALLGTCLASRELRRRGEVAVTRAGKMYRPLQPHTHPCDPVHLAPAPPLQFIMEDITGDQLKCGITWCAGWRGRRALLQQGVEAAERLAFVEAVAMCAVRGPGGTSGRKDVRGMPCLVRRRRLRGKGWCALVGVLLGTAVSCLVGGWWLVLLNGWCLAWMVSCLVRRQRLGGVADVHWLAGQGWCVFVVGV